MDKSGFLEIGRVGRAHGIQGEFKLRLHFEDSDALQHADALVVETPAGEARRLQVETIRGTAKEPIVAVKEVNSRGEVDSIKGGRVWVARSLLPDLGPGEYYLVDLVGCEVFLGPDRIGTVEGVRADPSVDTMIILLDRGGRALQPIVDAWVGRVDVARRRVDLESEDGLIDD